MTDEQRGQARPDGDVADATTGAGTTRTQQTDPTDAAEDATSPATPLGDTPGSPAQGTDGVDHPTLAHAAPTGSYSPYTTQPHAPGQYGSPQPYGSSGQYGSQSRYGAYGYGAQQGNGAGYGAPAYGPYSGGQGAQPGTTGTPGSGATGPGGPTDPPGGHTAVIEGERPRKASRPMVGIVAAALIAGIVGGGAGFGGAYALLNNGAGSTGTTLTGTPSSGTNAAATTNGTVAAAAAKVTPSTVDIRVTTNQGSAEGSGVILTSDGDVLTNNHVVAGSSGQITVTLADGSTHPATVVGTSPSYDLAVIKLNGVSGLTAATLGRTADVQVGQQVVAIGSPQGLTGTVTTGIISALNRTVAVQGEDGTGVVYNGLQTDTAINQGNSGGPLVNLDGQVVGINSAIATSQGSSGSIGLGFAIPVDQARRVAQEIMDTGKATKPVLGVQGAATTNAAQADTGGATLAAVTANGPAAAAGLKPGDVVTKVGNATVGDFSDLAARIGSYAPGDKVTLTVGSGSSARTVDVTLGSTEDTGATTSSGGSTSQQQNPFGGLNPFGNNGSGGGGSGLGGN
ncbi:MAG: trypsin-like peptidase domain-containing protein [Pseudonocardia sp.]|nr:trypsin-like peptidase domain-containing protein [Pseudonocardia sp.]